MIAHRTDYVFYSKLSTKSGEFFAYEHRARVCSYFLWNSKLRKIVFQKFPFPWLGILGISRPATPKNDRLTPVSIYFLLSHFERVLQNLTLFPDFAVLFLEFFIALFDFECILNSYLLLSIGHTDGLDLSPHGEFGATKCLQP